jgi:hypothetical protein
VLKFDALLAAKPLRAYPQLSQISKVVFVCTRYPVFLPTFYTQLVLPVTSAQCSLLTESWIARQNNTQWIATFRS